MSNYENAESIGWSPPKDVEVLSPEEFGDHEDEENVVE